MPVCERVQPCGTSTVIWNNLSRTTMTSSLHRKSCWRLQLQTNARSCSVYINIANSTVNNTEHSYSSSKGSEAGTVYLIIAPNPVNIYQLIQMFCLFSSQCHFYKMLPWNGSNEIWSTHNSWLIHVSTAVCCGNGWWTLFQVPWAAVINCCRTNAKSINRCRVTIGWTAILSARQNRNLEDLSYPLPRENYSIIITFTLL